jgi:hypothetical protein
MRAIACADCLWERTASGADAERRLRIMLRAHREVCHPPATDPPSHARA